MKLSLLPQHPLVLTVLAGLTLATASACGQSEAATPHGASAETAAAVAPAEGRAKVDEDVYTLEMAGKGPYKAGQEGAVEITLLAKADYHINDKYPIKFKAADPAAEGVSYPKPLLKRDDGKWEEKKGSLVVPFTAAKAGTAKVAGVLSFSVCSANNCRMEKQALEASVDVQ